LVVVKGTARDVERDVVRVAQRMRVTSFPRLDFITLS